MGNFDIFLAYFILIVLIFTLAVFLIRIPIGIAKSRNINGDRLNAISILSWFGILFGITWIVALVLSLVWDGAPLSNPDNLDRLEKLSKLYKDKVITKAEFDAEKAKLLKS